MCHMKLDNFILESYNNLPEHQRVIDSLMKSDVHSYLGNIYYMIQNIYKRKEEYPLTLNEFYIAYYNDYPVGIVSITYMNEREEMSCGILPQFEHQHLGSLLLLEFTEKIFALNPSLDSLYSVIDKKNIASQRMVLNTGGHKENETTFMHHR